jgi:hypothetical protein
VFISFGTAYLVVGTGYGIGAGLTAVETATFSVIAGTVGLPILAGIGLIGVGALMLNHYQKERGKKASSLF